ncbi:hypothetical protein CEXT_686501 [Caerostris extrusa]|uniref:Uncharacterized protein n=1 Tax=Caerostris extrusa TaxID=172846 RepID=A0AAV4RPF1_CAEEX|nr:hypothetical protein CEXT_686501 [Caerostris extrusa]
MNPSAVEELLGVKGRHSVPISRPFLADAITGWTDGEIMRRHFPPWIPRTFYLPPPKSGGFRDPGMSLTTWTSMNFLKNLSIAWLFHVNHSNQELDCCSETEDLESCVKCDFN